MCNIILIFSRCEKKLKENYQFHFRGFYCGKKIKSLVVCNSLEKALEVQHDYLLWAQKVDLIDGVLKVKIIKYKKIE